MSLNGSVWVPIGPSPITEGTLKANGQVTSIVPNPANPNVIYVGTAWGGIWRTDDGGNHWRPLFDRAPALGVGEPAALAMDPTDSNVLYAGSSRREGSEFSSLSTQSAAGLFKSTDGGASWIQLGSGYPAGNTGNAINFKDHVINVVIVDPDDARVVYLGSDRGVFRSVDGGLNWVQSQGLNGEVRSLVLDPSTPVGARFMYAGVTGQGVFKSRDSAFRWAPILTASTPAVASVTPTIGKCVVALAPPTSPPAANGVQILYATAVGNAPWATPDLAGIFISKDQGSTWTKQVGGAGFATSYDGYALHMIVDPASSGDGAHDILYLGTLTQYKSTDSGAVWTGIGAGVHADTHAWAAIKQPSPAQSIIFCGNDGGLFRSTNGGGTWHALNGNGIQTALVYNLDVMPDATASLTGGALQDNGVITNVSASWPSTSADGFDVKFDAGAPASKRVYACVNTAIYVSTDNGANFPTNITPPFGLDDQGLYLAPLATDPSTPEIVYVGATAHLWKSTTGGATWKKTPMPDLANDIEVAPTDGNYVAVALWAKVLVSTNALQAGGFTFTDITRNLPGRHVSRVAFDPNDPTILYAVLAGFAGQPGGHVYRTTLAATAWTDIGPANLDLPFNAIALDGSETPTAIYAGTDYGVLQSLDAGGTWSILDDLHFPRAPVFDLKLHNGHLRAATFGRGIFSFTKPVGPVIAVDPEDDLQFGLVCPGFAPEHLALTIFNVGSGDLLIKSVQRLMGSSTISVQTAPGTPLWIQPGEQAEFQVTCLSTTPNTAERATIRIATNDPAAPVVDLDAGAYSGTADARLLIADGGNFGSVCRGAFKDEQLTINNRGTCPLWIFHINSSSPDFITPVLSTSLEVAPADSVSLPIRFQPTALGTHTATITVTSNDPAGARNLVVSGVAPSGKLAVSGSPDFGGVRWGRREQRTLFITNVGSCTLDVSSVAFKTKRRHFRLINNPFPSVLPPGASLAVVVEYHATERIARSCELVISSDDPARPVETVELLAYSIPEECEQRCDDDSEEHDEDEREGCE